MARAPLPTGLAVKAWRGFGLLCLHLVAVGGAWAAEYQPSVTTLRFSTHTHIRADGSAVKEEERLSRVNNERGIELMGERRISYWSSLQDVEILEAWSRAPNGAKLAVAPDKIRTLEETDEGSPEFGDGKVRVLIFPALQVGSELYVKYRLVEHTPFFKGHFFSQSTFSPHGDIKEAKLSLVHEGTVPLKWQVRGLQGGLVSSRPTDPAGSRRYEFTLEPYKPSRPEAGRLEVSDYGSVLFVTTFDSYQALARAYQEGARPKAEPTPGIRKLAQELTAQAATPQDKVRVLYHWVSRHIRYVSLAVGAGGYVPHPAQSILDNRYGDCKDQVVLLEALLRSVGIESSPALVNSSRSFKLPVVAEAGYFDHVILYVPSLNLFLDSTARFAPMGTLPDAVMDKPVLLTASGTLARTPMTDPRKERTLTRFKMRLTPQGGVVGSSVMTAGGSMEMDSRWNRFDTQPSAMAATVNRLLSRYGETGTGELKHPDPLDLDAPWQVTATFELDPVVNVPGPSALTIPVGLGPANLHSMKTIKTQENRRFDFVCNSGTFRDEVELQVPPKLTIQRIPANASVKAGHISYQATYRKAGNTVYITRELLVSRPSKVCTVKDDAEWKAVLPVLQRDLQGQVFLR